MPRIKNFSHKERSKLDSDFNFNPQNFENRKTNELKREGFEEVRDKWTMLCSYFRKYPDVFIDFIQTDNPRIKLYFYQRIYLRIIFRFRKVFITATRGTSKSFLLNLAFVLLCIMYPNTKLFTTAHGKEQAAKITQECLDDIFEYFPLLEQEVKVYTRNKDYTKLVFYNKSKYDIVQMRDSTRGGRRHGGAIEEIVDKNFDGDTLNSVVIPLMANNRVAMCGAVDPNEIHKREVYITTAGTKQQFAYSKCKEIYSDMLKGQSAFLTGNSYDLPCFFGLLDIDFVEEKRDSPTYSIMDFMREYESIYTGSNADAFVSDEKLEKSRIVGIWEDSHSGEKNVEYVLAYDVARTLGKENALSALVVIKITDIGEKEYIKEVVNIYTEEGKHDTWQAKFLKEKVDDFKARILIVDANGLGSGVCDQLVLDLDDGFPPYKVVNDKNGDWSEYEHEDGIPILYALKSSNKETRNSDMIDVLMKQFSKRNISLLKHPYEGIRDFEKKNKRKFLQDSEDLSLTEVPYRATDALGEELMNLEYIPGAKGSSKIKQISRLIPKDKVMALMYGIYWIVLEEKKRNIKKEEYDWNSYFIMGSAWNSRV